MPRTVQPQSDQDSRKPGRLLRVRPAYLVLLLFMGLFAFKFVEKTQEIKTLTTQEVALQRQNQALESQGARTRANIARYRTLKYVEETARSILGYRDPGETTIQTSPPHPVRVEHVRVAPAPAPLRTAEDPAAQWWHIFFG